MGEYAPSPIKWLAQEWEARIQSAVISGIIGDRNHFFGYHRGANYIPSSDYSKQLSQDRFGVDGEAACALDISMNPADMILVTGRLKRSADDLNDPRLDGIREFAGTLDGGTTFNYDVQLRNQGYGQWDYTHLWHIHTSLSRSNANNTTVMKDVLSVVIGEPFGTAPKPEPKKEDDMQWILAEISPYTVVMSNWIMYRWVVNPADLANIRAQAAAGIINVWTNGQTLWQDANKGGDSYTKLGVPIGEFPAGFPDPRANSAARLLAAAAEADKARDLANGAAIAALSEVIKNAGGSVDMAAVTAAIKAAVPDTNALLDALNARLKA